jgi:hypothetical protein
MDTPESETPLPVFRGRDRRAAPTPMLSRYTFLGGRRRSGRRDGEVEDQFIDVYNPAIVYLLILFFALTVIDSVSTLVYLGKGGREMNPVAQWMIDRGPTFFIMTKGVLSAACLMFVMLHKNFKAARIALGLGFGFYFLLGVYHLMLQIMAS